MLTNIFDGMSSIEELWYSHLQYSYCIFPLLQLLLRFLIQVYCTTIIEFDLLKFCIKFTIYMSLLKARIRTRNHIELIERAAILN